MRSSTLAKPLLLALVVGLALPATIGAAPRHGTGRTFYLDLRPGQCAVWPHHHGKIVQVVPCSNPDHNLETYYVSRGGWGRNPSPPHATVMTVARPLCLSSFQRRFGHGIAYGYGWEAFWPDPGAEQAKYGDKMICSLIRWPGLGAMGPGLHH